MTIEEMKKRKRELGLSNEMLSKISGVPFGTIQKIFSGKTESPRQKTVLALEAALRPASRGKDSGHESEHYSRQDSGHYSGHYSRQDSGYDSGHMSASGYNRYAQTPVKPPMVAEPGAMYGSKKQGEYTLEDYYAIPDERRVELIDGEIFDMAAPSVMHQLILGELYLQFRACADAHEVNCRVLLSPCDVQLDNDDKTMVQPDLFVVCRDADLNGRSFPGAPDLTVEILSDSTRSKDMLLKTWKYKNAGVREYWIIDPRRKLVLVYDFSDEDLQPKTYSFTDSIPIQISDGRCRIDFGKINKELEALTPPPA